MKRWYASWNERVFYESTFETDAEEGSGAWYDAMFAVMEWCDSNEIDDMNVEKLND